MQIIKKHNEDLRVKITKFTNHNSMRSSILEEKTEQILKEAQTQINASNIAAASRLKVMRLIQRLIDTSLEIYMSELNDQLTRNSIVEYINQHLKTKSIKDYCIVCDESNNSPADINSGNLNLEVHFKTQEYSEFIFMSGSSSKK